MDASAIMEGGCCPPRIGSRMLHEGTIRGSLVLARGCDVRVLLAILGGGWALPCWRKGIRVPWLIGDCRSCEGPWGSSWCKPRCLLRSGDTGGGDSGGVLMSSRGTMAGTVPDGSATSYVSLAVCATRKRC